MIRRGIVLAVFLSIPGLFASSAERYGVILRGGRIPDGTGNPFFYGDVALADGRIARIGDLGDAAAGRTIEARGLYPVPGFNAFHDPALRVDRQSLTQMTSLPASVSPRG